MMHFVNNISEWLDSDGDGYGNNIDEFPYETTQWVDSDSDGLETITPVLKEMIV